MQRQLAIGAQRFLARSRPCLRRFCAQVATENVGTPPSGGVTVAASPRVQSLLDELVTLNMLEVKELTDGLKDRLGIDDSMAMPMNPAMFANMGGAPAAQKEEEVVEKTEFDLKLDKYDSAKKIAVIKEIRAITGLGLKEAKALVEEAPKVFKNAVPKEEAEQLREQLKGVGADVVLE